MSRPTKDSNKTSTRSTPSMKPRRPISAAKRMPAGRCLRAKYDDGGFSGGHTDRPALQRLLADVRSGEIDVIVVYKVDRLTRSLADFAKLVELFDKHNVSFVSVTQQFNTTTSMTAVVCPIRTRSHFRAHPGQDFSVQAQGALGRRHGPARLRHQRAKDHRQRG